LPEYFSENEMWADMLSFLFVDPQLKQTIDIEPP